MSEASIQKLKSIAAKVRASETISTMDSDVSDDTGKDDEDKSKEEIVVSSPTTSESKKTKVIYFILNNTVLIMSFQAGKGKIFNIFKHIKK